MVERFKIAVCVDVLIYRKIGDKSYFLFMQKNNKNLDEIEYELPGGHLEPNEDLIDALIREIKEELLVDVTKEQLKFAHLMHHYTGGRLNFIFTLNGENLVPKIGEPKKCKNLEWFSLDKIPQNLTQKLKQILDNIKNDIPFSSM